MCEILKNIVRHGNAEGLESTDMVRQPKGMHTRCRSRFGCTEGDFQMRQLQTFDINPRIVEIRASDRIHSEESAVSNSFQLRHVWVGAIAYLPAFWDEGKDIMQESS